MNPLASAPRRIRHGLIVAVVFVFGCGGGGGTSGAAPPAVLSPPKPPAPTNSAPVEVPNPFMPQPRTGVVTVMDADGRHLAAIAEGGWPDWSPDGEWLAFHRDGAIYVIRADGTSERRIRGGDHPAWSPDGSRLAYRSADGISVMNLDGSDVVSLVSHDFRQDTYAPWDLGVSKPTWSPDGDRIAFEHLGDGDSQPARVFVMNVDGSDVQLLTTYGDGIRYAESDPTWSPDGAMVALWSYAHGIATVASEGGAPTTVYESYPTVGYGARPSWSPDGRRLAFGLFLDHGIVISAVNGSDRTQVTTTGREPAWSVDGRIAFVTGVQCMNGWELTLWNTGSADESGFFFGSAPAADLNVRVGVPVSWAIGNQVAPYTAQIVSTSVPAGGAAIASPTLSLGSVFTFVPNVEGTWEYEDLVSGLKARITANRTTVPPGVQCD